MLNLDFDRICRLCLTKGEKMIAIFDGNGQPETGSSLIHRIERCTCLKLDKCDGLPSALCSMCLSEVDRIKEFQNQCERSDTVLREYLKKKNESSLKEKRHHRKQVPASKKVKKRGKGKQKKKCDGLYQKSVVSLDADTEWNICKAVVSPLDSNSTSNQAEECDKQLIQSDHPTSKLSKIQENGLEGDGNGSSSNDLCNGIDSDDHEFSWPNQLSDEELEISSDNCIKPLLGTSSTSASSARRRAGKKFQCEYCGRTFPRSNHLAQHELTHTKEKPFQCSYCQKGFWYKNSLIGHIKQTHTGDVNYTCEECGRGFFQKSEFMRHKPIHSSETPFKCDECDMSFKLMKNLRRHQKVHTATRTHTCQYCGKSFRMLQTLRVHLILHSGEKPYKCTYCGRGFSQSAPLKAHVRMHTGERPYVCNLCGESFPTGSSLKSHVFKHTGIHPNSCKECSVVFKRKRDLIDHRNKVHGGAETAPMQVPPQLPTHDQTYSQEPTANLNHLQPFHLQIQRPSHLLSSQIHQPLPHLGAKSFTNDAIDALSEDSLSDDLVSLQNQVPQVLGISSAPHLLSPSLAKSDAQDIIVPEMLHFV